MQGRIKPRPVRLRLGEKSRPFALLHETYDRQNLCFLICMWALGVIALFGVEIRSFLYRDESVYAVFLVVGFIASTFVVREILIISERETPSILIHGQNVPVELKPAHPKVQSYIERRVKHLGLNAIVDVYRLGRTWNVIDAYVVGRGEDQFIVLTGGAEALALRSSTQRSAFEFLIDHELGHIVHGDTSIMYLARATLVTLGIGLPIKLAILFARSNVIAAEMRTLAPGLFGADRVPEAAAAALLFAYTLVALPVLICLFQNIVRRREFLADQFASEHAGTRGNARKILEQLLGQGGLVAAPPHGFGGASRWHPAVAERLNAVRSRSVTAIPDAIAGVLVFYVLASTRFVLGATPGVEVPNPSTFEAITGLFALLFGYVVNCTLVPRNDHVSSRSRELARRGGAVVIWSTALSVAVAAATWGFSRSRTSGNGLEHIAFTERMLAAASIPVCVLCFILAFIALYWVVGKPKEGLQNHIAVSFFGSCLAVCLLWGLSAALAPVIAGCRNAGLSNASADSYLHAALVGSDVKTDRADQMLRAERIAPREFAPPLSFLLLWQAHFNRLR